MNRINIGIEIECVYNSKILNRIHKGNYHHGIKVPEMESFKAECDGSVHDNSYIGKTNKFGDYDTPCEFVSKVVHTKPDFFKMINSFKTYFSQNGKYELNEVVYFNETCGNHIHFSINGYLFKDKLLFELFPKLRKEFFKRLLKSNIKSKEEILKHYNRNYAKLSNKNNRNTRTIEFNTTEEHTKGLEWRSINFKGVQTWKEFEELYLIIFECLKFLDKMAMKWSKKGKLNMNFLKPLLEEEKIKEVQIECVI